MEVNLVEHYGNDLTPVNAARVSFANESEWERQHWDPVTGKEDIELRELSTKDTKLIHYLAKHKHTSCFEHQGATCRLKVPIFIARQIQRHRTFAYNEVSRRYVDNQPEFFWPDAWRARADNVKQGSGADHPNSEQWANRTNGHLMSVVNLYEEMLADGVAPEHARMILPQNMYTEFYMSGNLRNFSHFLKLRLDSHAQLEVRQVAEQMLEIFKPLWPVSIEALMSYD